MSVDCSDAAWGSEQALRTACEEYRESCASTTRVDIAHRRFNDPRTPTIHLPPETRAARVAFWYIKVCICRIISAVLVMFGLDHFWRFSHERIHWSPSSWERFESVTPRSSQHPTKLGWHNHKSRSKISSTFSSFQGKTQSLVTSNSYNIRQSRQKLHCLEEDCKNPMFTIFAIKTSELSPCQLS